MATQRELDRRAERMRPVFIVGAPRSGTSLLYQTLQRLDAFAVPNAPNGFHLGETDLVRHARKLMTFQERSPRKAWNFILRDRPRYGEFLASVRPLQQRAATLRRVEEKLGGRVRLTERFVPFHVVVRNYFVLAADARGCRRLVEKTPHHVGELALLRRAFRHARFLYIHRHPVDVYSSYRRRFALEGADAPWADLSVEQFVDLYRSMSSTAIAEARRGDLLLVGYERFVAEPKQVFTEVCAFLGEPADLTALEPDDARPRGELADPHLFSPITEKTKEWQEHVSVDDAGRVEAALGDVMAAWGYAPYVARAA